MGTTSVVAGLSLVMETDDEVARAAALLTALGLEISGEDGFVVVDGPSISLSIMRGAMIDVAPLGGVLIQLRVNDVDAAAKLAGEHGGTLAGDPVTTEWGSYSAYLRGPGGLVLELMTDKAA